ncbi:MAG: hypothetical protein H6668_01210 [Ardenticatenaceae bacterium]|nr:hypothetical protein [Ardenticatenaceae bacterium]
MTELCQHHITCGVIRQSEQFGFWAASIKKGWGGGKRPFSPTALCLNKEVGWKTAVLLPTVALTA